MSENEMIVMTLEGYTKLKEELEYRKVEGREEVSKRIKVGLSFGDLSENSEYDDAKAAQAENERRIAELENILKNVRVLDDEEISKTKVSLGVQVKVKDEQNGETEVYTIVNAREEDIFERRISSESPVGKALIGRKKGDVVEVKTPMGQLKYKIVKIGK